MECGNFDREGINMIEVTSMPFLKAQNYLPTVAYKQEAKSRLRYMLPRTRPVSNRDHIS